MIDLNKPLEDIDYKVVTYQDPDYGDAWYVEVLRDSNYAGVALAYEDIQYDGRHEQLSFIIVAADADGHEIELDSELEDLAANILTDMINNLIARGGAVFSDKDSNN